MIQALKKKWNQLYGLTNSIKPLKLGIHMAKELDNLRQRKKRLMFYSQFLSKGDLCFDIGANTGNRTAIFAELGCKVVAVEPQEECLRQLMKKFGKNKRVTLVKKAVAEKTGKKELYICHADAISSTSKDWIEAVKRSGRYVGFKWSRKETVATTTLDELIKEFGKPAFCKIDVEGSELSVLNGLTKPIRHLSFEFSTDYMPAATKSIHYLSKLGQPLFNYSAGESMKLALNEWVDARQIIRSLKHFHPRVVWGDVYVWFSGTGVNR